MYFEMCASLFLSLSLSTPHVHCTAAGDESIAQLDLECDWSLEGG